MTLSHLMISLGRNVLLLIHLFILTLRVVSLPTCPRQAHQVNNRRMNHHPPIVMTQTLDVTLGGAAQYLCRTMHGLLTPVGLRDQLSFSFLPPPADEVTPPSPQDGANFLSTVEMLLPQQIRAESKHMLQSPPSNSKYSNSKQEESALAFSADQSRPAFCSGGGSVCAPANTLIYHLLKGSLAAPRWQKVKIKMFNGVYRQNCIQYFFIIYTLRAVRLVVNILEIINYLIVQCIACWETVVNCNNYSMKHCNM